jgi:hypothetical protein
MGETRLYLPRTCADLKHRPGWVGGQPLSIRTVNMFSHRRLRIIAGTG